jgi:hypothetical protein
MNPHYTRNSQRRAFFPALLSLEAFWFPSFNRAKMLTNIWSGVKARSGFSHLLFPPPDPPLLIFGKNL